MRDDNTLVTDLTNSPRESTDLLYQNDMAMDDDILSEFIAHFPTLKQILLPQSYKACATAQATDNNRAQVFLATTAHV